MATSPPRPASGAESPTGAASSASPRGLGRVLRGRLGLVLAAALVALAVHEATPVGEGGRNTALTTELAGRGLVASADDVVWVDRPTGLGATVGRAVRAIVRAAPAKGEPADLFLVEAHLSPEGVLLGVDAVHTLTDTSGADELLPIVDGARVAYVARGLSFDPGEEAGAGIPPAWVHVLELGRGEPPAEDWTPLERAQLAVTRFQETGRTGGVGHLSFAVDPPPREVRLRFASGRVVVSADERSAQIAPDALVEAELPPWLRLEPAELARPGNLVTWSVDRVRAIPWIGDDTMQTVKAVAFTALDFVLRNKEAVTGDTGEASIAEDLGQSALASPTKSAPVDPEVGWPPSPLEAWVTPALAGEGQWNSLAEDPFLSQPDGLPPVFVTTFIRSDLFRKATRVYIAMWDPRMVELHMMAGTVEPKGATGEAGPGLIPRTPEVLRRVVGASNAGFQALHGEFGMMADGVVYLPPKPYAASVAVLRDGSTAFGSWPENQVIPDEVRSYRQNMTVMVLDQKFNPYNRTWWGGTPPGWADKTHTVRTGICLTKERFVAYFYGADIGPEALSQAMIQARCGYGIALDMNAGHSGLEFYKVGTAAEVPPLDRPVHTDWEAEGEVQGMDGYRYRGRRFIRGMGLMNFPRYIRRESRDFFYMTLRPLLPGPKLALGREPGFEGEGAWSVKGLPQQGFPYALARADVALGASRARLLALDPRLLRAAPASAAADGATVVILDAGEARGGEALWHSVGAFAIGPEPPVESAVRLVSGSPSAVQAAGAVCIRDDDGMAIYLDAGGMVASSTLEPLLRAAGCTTFLYLDAPWPLALGGDTDLAGAAVHAPTGASAVRLARAPGPGGKRIFEDTPIVPFDVWYTLQQKRIRYFKKRESEAAAEPAP
jgi:hypothetical protein